MNHEEFLIAIHNKSIFEDIKSEPEEPKYFNNKEKITQHINNLETYNEYATNFFSATWYDIDNNIFACDNTEQKEALVIEYDEWTINILDKIDKCNNNLELYKDLINEIKARNPEMEIKTGD